MGSLHPRSLTWLSAASALGALVFGTWLLVRDGGRLSDGVRGYSAEDAPRYATWGAPRPAPYGNADGATRAALSRDGRWLAWSRPAEDGAGGEELYLAEVREGRAGVGVRIDGLCTESDENGPAFGDAFLYFASNRPSALGEGGGFDLWRASFEDGVVGEPEPVPGPANSPADELDPAPLSGETELVFSRVSQGEDADLYLAPIGLRSKPTPRSEPASADEATGEGADAQADERVAGAGEAAEPVSKAEARRIEALCSERDERGALFTAEDRALVFASDRAGGAGGFDLYRASRLEGRFGTPRVLAELSSADHERAPCTISDPLALAFTRAPAEQAGSGGVFLVSHPVELFRAPAVPISWMEWLALAGLLLLALLALLARRFPALESFTKCLLVSVLLHLLLVWYLHERLLDLAAQRDERRREPMQVRLETREERLEAERPLTAALEEPEEPPVDRVPPEEPPEPEPRPEVAAVEPSQPASRVSEEASAEIEPTSATRTELALPDPTPAAERTADSEPTIQRAELAALTAEAPRADSALEAAVDRGERPERPRHELETPQPSSMAGASNEPLEDEELARSAERPAELLLPAPAEAASEVARDAERVGPAREAISPVREAPASHVAAIERVAEEPADAPARSTEPLEDVLRERPASSTSAIEHAIETAQALSAAEGAPELELSDLAARASSVTSRSVGSPSRASLERPSGSPANAPASAPTVASIEAAAAEQAGASEARDRARSLAGAAGLSAGSSSTAASAQPLDDGAEAAESAGAGPELALGAPVTAGERGSARAESQPGRADLAPAGGSRGRPEAPRTPSTARAASEGASRDDLAGSARAKSSPESFEPGDSLAGSSRATSSSERAGELAAPAPEAPELALGGPVAGSERRPSAAAGGPRRASEERAPCPARAQSSVGGVASAAAPAPAARAPARAGGAIEDSGPGRVGEAFDFTPDAGAEVASTAGARPEESAGNLLDGLAPESLGRGAVRPAESGSTPMEAGPRRAAGGGESLPRAAPERPSGEAGLALADLAREAQPERRPAKSEWDATPYRNRSGAEKERALEEFGGSEETEAAVRRGLAYLARIQGRDGAWGDVRAVDPKYGRVAIGKTGLATLAFLGAGHTPASGTEHSAVVARALEFLLGVQDAASGHFGDASAYDHGIATYAIAECFALTRDARLRGPLERAIAHVLAMQDRRDDPRFHGGWGYYFADGSLYDPWPRTSITAWQVMALESARLSGLEVPDEAFAAVREFLEHAKDPELGAYRYNHDPERLSSPYATLPASTPAALFALALLGDDVTAREHAVAREYTLARAPDGYRYEGEMEFVRMARGNPYFWYYGTLAMFRVGGEEWRRWNAALQECLLPAQSDDGSWQPIDPYARYARDGARDKSYTTALCVLSLEIYYRYYLPLLKVR